MRIVKILDDYTYIINKGTFEGVIKGQKCYIYIIGEEIIDPNSGMNLGSLEIPKAYCTVTHVQDNMSIIQSDDAPSPYSLSAFNIKLKYDYFERNLETEEKKIKIGDNVKIVKDI
jgi:transcription antitermination factor NusG